MGCRNLYQSLKPTFYTASLFGMVPWMKIKSTSYSNPEEIMICKASSIQWIYALLEIVLLLCLIYPKWLYVTTTEMFNLTNISSLFEFVIPYSIYLGFGTICTMTLLRAKHQILLIEKIIKVDQNFRDFKLDMNYKAVQRISVFGVFLPVIVYILIVTLDIYSFEANIYATLLIVIEVIYLVGFPFYYSYLVRIVSRWVKFMTLILKSKIRDSADVPRGVDFCQDDVRALKKIYNNVSDVVAGINKEYGIQIAQLFILDYISLPYYSYFLYLMIKKNSGVLSIVDTVVWLGIYGLPVVYVAVTCESVNTASLRMAYVVHKAIKVVPGIRTKMDLNMLSLQMTHDKFEFSAFGLFTINHEFLTFIKGITTYLVILIQFDIQESTGSVMRNSYL